ncbi:MAG: hypothetical protein UT34_C0002G0020 [candidate division WS6 bacterium GW2011_GWF2_39_15]|uniref:OmpR/PhoB-type domain-containing protein n=1 Tax=candidate division WS6 bacterium GW2011_GWF2_39_15 TaxID=1619100 RepID=A0A0G0MQU9_9BACT|nr:MAG: hypothetical protein UT34_C0002G0020 [candidate division WS6 bacterium GW2011_GWF2_39_15]
MTYPKVTVKSGKDIDSINYLHTYEAAKAAFFQSKKYIILPYIPMQKRIAGKTIFLPRISRKMGAGIKYTELIDYMKFPKINENKYREYITRNFKAFWKDLIKILGEEKLSRIKNIEVWITHIGSGGRAFTEMGDNSRIVVIMRKDMILQQIFSLVIMEVLPYIGYKESYTWEETTAIREWLVESTVLNKYFPVHTPMLDSLRERKQQAKYLLDSDKYLQEIGIKGYVKILNNEVLVDNTKIVLGEKETLLFSLLLSRKGGLVDYDIIFKEVWGSNIEKFSLYAITKLVERIRKKLLNAGISEDIIHTYKGKGYYIGSSF